MRMGRKRGRGVTLGVVFLAIAVLRGQSCGPFFTDAIFVLHQPKSREELMGGDPGIIWPDFGIGDLALAYRALQGPAFTADEIAGQKAQAILTDSSGSSAQKSTGDGVAKWFAARQAFTGQNHEPISTDATVPGQQWQSYGNCLEDAFVTAAKTLEKREADYPSDKSSIEAWVTGQDAVFSNCNAQGQLPVDARASTPDWLRRDRAYQSAAAHFYRSEWQPAQAGFTAIAGDKGSPWHDLASYMVARTMIRRATLSKSDGVDQTMLREAGAQLSKIQHGGGRYAPAAQALLNYVEVRVAPGATAARLGDAISMPDPNLRQDLIDLRYAMNNPVLSDQLTDARRSDLVDWVLSVKGNVGRADGGAHALARWQATKNPAWLALSIMMADAPQPNLIAAGSALSRSSPAWATVTYHRLRLTQGDPGFEAEVTALLPQIKTISTRNAFQELAQLRAGSLEQFINLAAMEPAAYDDGMGDLTTPSLVVPKPTGRTTPTMAGLPVDMPDAPRFNQQSAAVLNEQLPLETLAAIVQRRAFSKQLQFELAMAVWTRAVLLGRPDIARSLSPEMIEGESGWKQWLDAYNNARTDSDRQIAALLALMRFPSVRPYVNAGPIREDGFVGYSAYRDNWWCAGMGKSQGAVSSYAGSYNYSAAYVDQSNPPPPFPVKQDLLPPFITAAMLLESARENAALKKIGDAPEYFGKESLAWVMAHPGDPRGAELLGFAFRAMRNGCNLEKSYTLRREVFDTLHSSYRQSEWAQRYPNFAGDT